ncbi:MAG: Rpn family recombination-promoting nuclease/putative transposase [Bacteroidetes bacterium]|nr:MAG: Rpn family recombination-promoting nuclease/putative transposase [Bacteroidota bacterium]
MSKVNPKIDLVFKKLFGSEENKDILLSLINAILPFEQQVAKIVLKNPYNVSDYAEGKLSILDIKAEGEDGRLFDVEMQIRGSKYYGKRALFYWAKIFGSQLDYVLDDNQDNDDSIEVGYSDLKKCIVISLMDFNFFDDTKYHRFYTIKDGETHEAHKDLDYLDLYFIELKKYKAKLQNLNTTLERWITFLNNAHKYDNKTLPKELAEIKEIRKASQKLDAMYLDEKEKGYYDAQQKFWLDQNAFIKETVEKAVEQAELNSKIEIAKTAIRKELDNEFISELTGLTVEKIEQLRNEYLREILEKH